MTRYLLLALLAPSIPAIAGDFSFIVPGTKMGAVRIGETIQDVRSRMKKPDRGYATHHGCRAEQWDRPDGSLLEVVHKSGVVLQIKTNSSRYQTRQGVNPRSGVNEVRRAFPGLRRTIYLRDTESGKGVEYLDDVRRGIAFASPVPAARGYPFFVVVHRPGYPAIPTEVGDLNNRGSVSFPASRSRASTTERCRSFVQAFYDRYVKQSALERDEPAWMPEVRAHPTLFSTQLRRGLREDAEAQAKVQGTIVGLDFDPFMNANDPADEYRVREVTKVGSTYRVAVHAFLNGKVSKTPDVIAELQPSGNGFTFLNFHYRYPDDPRRKADLLGVLAELRKGRLDGR